MNWLQRFIATKLLDTIDAAIFYVVLTYGLGLTVTWPVVLAVAFAVDGYNGYMTRQHAKKEDLRKARILTKARRS